MRSIRILGRITQSAPVIAEALEDIREGRLYSEDDIKKEFGVEE